MNNSILPYAFHTLILALLQFLILKDFSIPVFGQYSITVFIYPLIIIALPIKTPRALSIVLAFFFGLVADFFYDSPGVHAATLMVMAYCRSYILKILEPRGGFRTEDSPSAKNYGINWFMTYSATMLIVHLLVYFSIDAFTFVFIDKILINTLLSFVISYLLILFYQLFMRI